MNAFAKIIAADEAPKADTQPVTAPAAELRAVDCNTPEQWAQWARERMERDDPYGHSRGRW